MSDHMPWSNGAAPVEVIDPRPEWARTGETPIEPTVDELPKVRARHAARRSVAVVLVAAVAGFAGGRIGDSAAPAAVLGPQATQATAGPTSTPPATSGLAALYKLVAPSVVQILTTGGREQGSGSGVIVDAGGTVLTNQHVVSGNSTVRLTLSDGRDLTGTVAGTDPQWDLAVVKIENPPADLTQATLGDSDAVAPGDEVFAIGAPFGFQGSITAGVVSAINRVFGGNDQYPPMRGLIQTDAAINPGNSGGPLFNTSGEVVGITTAIESPVGGSVGVGFAVPIGQAQRALPALVGGDAVTHPFLGIQGEEAVGGGVSVVAITPGSAAESAGLRAGDVIVSVAGTDVGSIDEVARELEKHEVGQTIQLRVRRGSALLTITVTLGAYQGG